MADAIKYVYVVGHYSWEGKVQKLKVVKETAKTFTIEHREFSQRSYETRLLKSDIWFATEREALVERVRRSLKRLDRAKQAMAEASSECVNDNALLRDYDATTANEKRPEGQLQSAGDAGAVVTDAGGPDAGDDHCKSAGGDSCRYRCDTPQG
jgi:hypothetical protein